MRELSLHILDIVQNSLAAGSDEVEIKIYEDTKKDIFVIKIADNGRGIKKENLGKITDPFVTSRSVRDVGLGLSLLRAAARRCEGEVNISSKYGKGTVVRAEFKYSHIDRAPLGNITDTIISLIAVNPGVKFKFIYKINNRIFVFNTAEVKERLENIEINQHRVLNWIKDYLQKNIEKLAGGELNEITGRTAGITN